MRRKNITKKSQENQACSVVTSQPRFAPPLLYFILNNSVIVSGAVNLKIIYTWLPRLYSIRTWWQPDYGTYAWRSL